MITELNVYKKNSNEVENLLYVRGISGDKNIAFIETDNFEKYIKENYHELYKLDVDYFLYYTEKIANYAIKDLIEFTDKKFNFTIVHRDKDKLVYFFPIKK